MRRPSFQFYPADWRKDPGLRACSPSARAIWIDMLCLAHECEPYGTLCIKERAMTTQQLASAIGTTGKAMQQAIVELETNGVFSRDACGCIYSRRMVRDERLRTTRAAGGIAGKEHGIKGKTHGSKGAEHGIKGGRPKVIPPPTSLQEGGGEGGLETPAPSSSASFVSKNLRPKPSSAMPIGFAGFWTVYPRKIEKKDAIKAWTKLAPDQALIDRIMAAVAVALRSEEWNRGSQFIPHAATWLNGERWEDELTTATHGSGATGEWWKTDAATLAKQQELGLSSRAGESWQNLRERIRQRLNETQP